MTITTTPKLGISRFDDSQGGAATLLGTDFNLLDTLCQSTVINASSSGAAPGSPSEGDAYILSGAGTGSNPPVGWNGLTTGTLVCYYNGWIAITPKAGWRVWNVATKQVLRYTGSAWVSMSETVLQSRSFTYLNPTGSLNVGLFFTQQAIVIQKAVAVVVGTSLTWNVKRNTSRNAAGTALLSSDQATTSNTTGDTITSFSSASFAANSFIWLTSSAVTACTEFDLTLFFNETLA